MLTTESLREMEGNERRNESSRKNSTAFQMSDLLVGRRSSVSSRNSISSEKQKGKLLHERKRAQTEEKEKQKGRGSISEDGRAGSVHYFSKGRTGTGPHRPFLSSSSKHFSGSDEDSANGDEKVKRSRKASFKFTSPSPKTEKPSHLLSPQPLPFIPRDLFFPLKETEKHPPLQTSTAKAEAGASEVPFTAAKSLSASTLAPFRFPPGSGGGSYDPLPYSNALSSRAVDDGPLPMFSYPSQSVMGGRRLSQPRNVSPSYAPGKSFPATTLLPLPTLGLLHHTSKEGMHVGIRSAFSPIVVMVLLAVALFLVAIPPLYFINTDEEDTASHMLHLQLTYIAVLTSIISVIGGAMKYLVESRFLLLLSQHVKNAIRSVNRQQAGMENRIEEEKDIFANWLAMMKEKYNIVDGEEEKPDGDTMRPSGGGPINATALAERREGAGSPSSVLAGGEEEEAKAERNDNAMEGSSSFSGTIGGSTPLFSPMEGMADSSSPITRNRRVPSLDEGGGNGSEWKRAILLGGPTSHPPQEARVPREEHGGARNAQGRPFGCRNVRSSKSEEGGLPSSPPCSSRLPSHYSSPPPKTLSPSGSSALLERRLVKSQTDAFNREEESMTRKDWGGMNALKPRSIQKTGRQTMGAPFSFGSPFVHSASSSLSPSPMAPAAVSLPPTMPPFFAMSIREPPAASLSCCRGTSTLTQSTRMSHGQRWVYSRKYRSDECGALQAGEEGKSFPPKKRASRISRKFSSLSSSIHAIRKESLKSHITNRFSSFRKAPTRRSPSSRSSGSDAKEEEEEEENFKSVTQEKRKSVHHDPQGVMDPPNGSHTSPSSVADHFVVLVNEHHSDEDDGKTSGASTLEASTRDPLYSCHSPTQKRNRLEREKTPPPHEVGPTPFSYPSDKGVSPLHWSANPATSRYSSRFRTGGGGEPSLPSAMALPPVLGARSFYPFPSAIDSNNVLELKKKPAHDAIVEELGTLHECLKALFIDLYTTSNSSIRFLLILMAQLLERVHCFDTLLMQWSLFVDHHEQFEYFFYQWERSMRKGKKVNETTAAAQDRPGGGGGGGGGGGVGGSGEENIFSSPPPSCQQFGRSTRPEGEEEGGGGGGGGGGSNTHAILRSHPRQQPLSLPSHASSQRTEAKACDVHVGGNTTRTRPLPTTPQRTGDCPTPDRPRRDVPLPVQEKRAERVIQDDRPVEKRMGMVAEKKKKKKEEEEEKEEEENLQRPLLPSLRIGWQDARMESAEEPDDAGWTMAAPPPPTPCAMADHSSPMEEAEKSYEGGGKGGPPSPSSISLLPSAIYHFPSSVSTLPYPKGYPTRSLTSDTRAAECTAWEGVAKGAAIDTAPRVPSRKGVENVMEATSAPLPVPPSSRSAFQSQPAFCGTRERTPSPVAVAMPAVAITVCSGSDVNPRTKKKNIQRKSNVSFMTRPTTTSSSSTFFPSARPSRTTSLHHPSGKPPRGKKGEGTYWDDGFHLSVGPTTPPEEQNEKEEEDAVDDVGEKILARDAPERTKKNIPPIHPTGSMHDSRGEPTEMEGEEEAGDTLVLPPRVMWIPSPFSSPTPLLRVAAYRCGGDTSCSGRESPFFLLPCPLFTSLVPCRPSWASCASSKTRLLLLLPSPASPSAVFMRMADPVRTSPDTDGASSSSCNSSLSMPLMSYAMHVVVDLMGGSSRCLGARQADAAKTGPSLTTTTGWDGSLLPPLPTTTTTSMPGVPEGKDTPLFPPSLSHRRRPCLREWVWWRWGCVKKERLALCDGSASSSPLLCSPEVSSTPLDHHPTTRPPATKARTMAETESGTTGGITIAPTRSFEPHGGGREIGIEKDSFERRHSDRAEGAGCGGASAVGTMHTVLPAFASRASSASFPTHLLPYVLSEWQASVVMSLACLPSRLCRCFFLTVGMCRSSDVSLHECLSSTISYERRASAASLSVPVGRSTTTWVVGTSAYQKDGEERPAAVRTIEELSLSPPLPHAALSFPTDQETRKEWWKGWERRCVHEDGVGVEPILYAPAIQTREKHSVHLLEESSLGAVRHASSSSFSWKVKRTSLTPVPKNNAKEMEEAIPSLVSSPFQKEKKRMTPALEGVMNEALGVLVNAIITMGALMTQILLMQLERKSTEGIDAWGDTNDHTTEKVEKNRNEHSERVPPWDNVFGGTDTEKSVQRAEKQERVLYDCSSSRPTRASKVDWRYHATERHNHVSLLNDPFDFHVGISDTVREQIYVMV